MGLFEKTPIFKVTQKILTLEGRENQIFRLVLDNKTIKDLIVFLNTDQQLGTEHVDSLGQALFNSLTDRTTYSLFDKKGRGGQPYTLEDTGAFYRSFKTTIGNGFIIIESDPFKGDDNLFETYGKEIEGLTESSLEALIKIAHEFFVKWYRKQILGN